MSVDSDATKTQIRIKKLGYLSAAPRVSTRDGAEAGGPRAHVLGVIQAFESLGWEVIPFIVGDRMPRILINQSEKRMERSVLVRLVADIVRLIMGLYQSVQAWRELHGKIDLVYERFAVLQALGWIFQDGKTPWILETSGLYFYEAAVERKSIVLTRIAKAIEIWAYRRCDVLVCVTDVLRDLIVKEAGISIDKILVVPNGVDNLRFDPKKHKPKRLFEGPTIGFVSALLRWHRLDILIDAIAELKTEGIHFNLVVAGDGPMRSVWEGQARELDLSGSTHFVGQIPWDEVPAFMSGFDVGYMGNNSMDIGSMYHSPLKLYEYMAMSLPVVASAFSDSRDMIIPGISGYLFEAGNKEDLKRVMRLAYKDQSNWKKMGIAARKHVLEQASWYARVQVMIKGIERILAK